MIKIASTIFALAIGIGFSTFSDAAAHCPKGKPCGNSCIAKDKTCHLDNSTKVCKTGKPCGNGCIAKDKTCKKSL